ncbi:hypothetical protein AQ619_15605 [Caulobacter henricii]|uniref:Uncharacterized protein n=1 Tax=Caulobacter henricii TaxID=69395 RepID=A0A0P0P302_9CAUL|nr:hypothetical protein AQ619_15605 [Caulobacter henricii]
MEQSLQILKVRKGQSRAWHDIENGFAHAFHNALGGRGTHHDLFVSLKLTEDVGYRLIEVRIF